MTSRLRGVRLLWLVAVVVAAVVAGCAVGPQSTPQPIQTKRPAAPSAPVVSQEVSEQSVVYLVLNGRLAPVTRLVPASSGIDGVLAAVSAGPTAQEAAGGYRTSLPAATEALHADISDGVATLAMPANFATLGLTQQVIAVGQLVYTVTEIDGVSALQLTDGHRDVSMPVSGGRLVTGPVQRSDYAAIAPR